MDSIRIVSLQRNKVRQQTNVSNTAITDISAIDESVLVVSEADLPGACISVV